MDNVTAFANTPTPNANAVLTQTVTFKGTTAEYFRIWMVNNALTILTLGVYSAWAKVRSRRFLYGNTFVGDTNFAYHGKPLSILKGRLILAALLGVGFVIQHALHLHRWQWVVLLFPVAPGLIALGMKFTARNTSYRGVRFNFDPNFKSSYATFGIIAFATLLSGGLGAAFVPFLYTSYRLSNLGYGPFRFKFKQEFGPFWRVYFKATLISVALILSASALAFLAFHGSAKVVIAITLGVLAALVPSAAVVRVGLLNETARQTSLGPITFRSELKAWDMVGLYVSNGAAILFSLGLLTPWAIIRTYKYRASKMTILVPAAAMAELKSSGPQLVTPGFQEAMADIADFDLGF